MDGCIGSLSGKRLMSEKLDVATSTGKTAVQAIGELKCVSARGKNAQAFFAERENKKHEVPSTHQPSLDLLKRS